MRRQRLPPGPRRPWPLMVIAGAVAFACLAGGWLATVQFMNELTRAPTQDELNSAAAAEVAGRWRAWPLGKIFPERVEYAAETAGTEKATRVGIDTGTSCAEALERPPAGCRAVLRATYLDPLQGLVTTAGLVVFPDAETARQARKGPRLRALALPRTAGAQFTDAARLASARKQDGPYLLLATTGYTDGRPATGKLPPEIKSMADEIGTALLERLVVPSKPDCTNRNWSC